MTTPTPTLHTPPKLAYRIDEAVKATGLGRSFLYERMAEGSLKSVKIGGRRLILLEDLVAFLNKTPRSADASEQSTMQMPDIRSSV